MKYLVVVIGLLASIMFNNAKATDMITTDDKPVDPSYDDGSGWYLGLNLGYDLGHWDQNSFFRSNSFQTLDSRDTGSFAGRVMFGYKANRNFAVEAGYAYFAPVKANVTTPVGTSATVKANTFIVDILARMSLEFQHGFIGYAKFGFAYVESYITYTGNIDSNSSTIRPEVGVGVGYNITKNILFNVEWLHVFNYNNNAFNGLAQQEQVLYGGTFTKLPEMDMFLAGFIYRF